MRPKLRIQRSVIVAGLFFSLCGYGVIFALTVCFVMLHEFAHILVAHYFGLHCSQIDVTPIGLRATIRSLEKLSLYRRLLVFLAGPVCSLSISFLPLPLYCSQINLAIGLFNLLPILPLDGGVAAYFLYSRKFGAVAASKIAFRLSLLLAVVFIVLGLVQLILYPYNISLFVMGVYLFKRAPSEYSVLLFSCYQNFSLPYYNTPIRVIVMAHRGKEISHLTLDYFTVFYYFENEKWYRRSQCDVMRDLINPISSVNT